MINGIVLLPLFVGAFGAFVSLCPWAMQVSAALLFALSGELTQETRYSFRLTNDFSRGKYSYGKDLGKGGLSEFFTIKYTA